MVAVSRREPLRRVAFVCTARRFWYAALVEERHRLSAARARQSIQRGLHHPSQFRAALLRVPSSSRDAWVDLVLGLDENELPEDSPELPRGCVPYLPCSADALLRVVHQAEVQASDVFVDIGSGLGRAATLVHLLTGASAIGLEIQPTLVLASRDLASRLLLTHVPCIEGDAAELTEFVMIGTVFFLYCPFSGHRLAKVLDDLESIARTRMLRICCVDLPLPLRDWLTPDPVSLGDLAVYRSTLHP
jgi:SAM-dependent methyltransferase